MSFLNELRILLIDARIALRETRADEDEDPLWTRLEKAIRDISTYVLPPPAANTKTTAQQVALAWQTVCRGVKLTHPELYDELAGKVMRLLDEKELVEPVTELLQLEAQVKKLEAGQKAFETRMAELGGKAGDAQARLDQLALVEQPHHLLRQLVVERGVRELDPAAHRLPGQRDLLRRGLGAGRRRRHDFFADLADGLLEARPDGFVLDARHVAQGDAGVDQQDAQFVEEGH